MAVKRTVDILLSFIFIVILALPMLLIALIIKLNSRGPIVHWSARMGRNNQVFNMPKFRSMHVNTPTVASKHLENPNDHLTSFGKLLRKTSLDELPQLVSVLAGKMSLVGPRPVILAENDVIEARRRFGVDRLLPGITGWAQINGRDHLTLEEKVNFEAEYLQKQSLTFDLKIMMMTFLRVIRAHGISH